MTAHIFGLPAEELLWMLPGGAAAVVARTLLTLLVAGRPLVLHRHESQEKS